MKQTQMRHDSTTRLSPRSRTRFLTPTPISLPRDMTNNCHARTFHKTIRINICVCAQVHAHTRDGSCIGAPSSRSMVGFPARRLRTDRAGQRHSIRNQSAAMTPRRSTEHHSAAPQPPTQPAYPLSPTCSSMSMLSSLH